MHTLKASRIRGAYLPSWHGTEGGCSSSAELVFCGCPFPLLTSSVEGRRLEAEAEAGGIEINRESIPGTRARCPKSAE
jgi:hypothetical protein